MNRIMRFVVCSTAFVALFSLTALSHAQSPFDGTWRIDLAKAKLDQKPFTVYTSQGWYHCVSCTPPYDNAADGQFHAIAGQTFDEESITIVDQRTMKFTDKKDGKTVNESTVTVSADGKMITIKTTSYPMNGAGPQDSSITLKRVGVLRPGVHATSGNWVPLKLADTEADLSFTFKSNGDELTMTVEVVEGKNVRARCRRSYGLFCSVPRRTFILRIPSTAFRSLPCWHGSDLGRMDSRRRRTDRKPRFGNWWRMDTIIRRSP